MRHELKNPLVQFWSTILNGQQARKHLHFLVNVSDSRRGNASSLGNVLLPSLLIAQLGNHQNASSSDGARTLAFELRSGFIGHSARSCDNFVGEFEFGTEAVLFRGH
jgi:hypothetical protein